MIMSEEKLDKIEENKEEKEDGRKGEFIRVRKEKLDEMIKRLERLEASASKASLAHYDEKHKDKVGRVIRLKAIDGKVIVNWEKMPENLVEKNERGVWYEKQAIRLHYEDGSVEDMPYVFFSRRYTYIEAEVVSETKNLDPEIISKQGDFTYKLRTDDAEYEIGSLCVN